MKPQFLALIATATMAITGAQAQDIVLKIAHFVPPHSVIQKDVLEPWCATLGKETQGRVKCQIYASMQLGGTPPQLIDQVKNGIADIVWTAPSYTPGRFPAMETMELPFIAPRDVLAGSRAIWEFYRKHAQEEFAGHKVLAVQSGGGQLLSTNRPIEKPEDFKGLKLRAPSRMTSKLLVAQGATPVNIAAGQITDALSKGVINGVLAPWELVASIRLDESTKFHTEPPAGQPTFSAVSLVLLMNEQKYQSLPQDVRAVIDRHSGDVLVEAIGNAFDTSNRNIQQRVATRGNTLVALSAENFAAIRSAATVVENEWIKDRDGKGQSGTELATSARAISAKHLAKP